MPYIKQQSLPLELLKRTLRGYGLNSPKLAAILGCAPSTAWDKLKNPEKLTLGDILKIAKRGHIPIEELREAIKL